MVTIFGLTESGRGPELGLDSKERVARCPTPTPPPPTTIMSSSTHLPAGDRRSNERWRNSPTAGSPPPFPDGKHVSTLLFSPNIRSQMYIFFKISYINLLSPGHPANPLYKLAHCSYPSQRLAIATLTTLTSLNIATLSTLTNIQCTVNTINVLGNFHFT